MKIFIFKKKENIFFYLPVNSFIKVCSYLSLQDIINIRNEFPIKTNSYIYTTSNHLKLKYDQKIKNDPIYDGE